MYQKLPDSCTFTEILWYIGWISFKRAPVSYTHLDVYKRQMVDAIPYLKDEKAVSLFERFGVFTRAELESRVEIKYETYSKIINIEARSMIDIATKQIIPAVVKYTTVLANSINSVRMAADDVDVSVQKDLLSETSCLLRRSKTALEELKVLTDQASAMRCV